MSGSPHFVNKLNSFWPGRGPMPRYRLRPDREMLIGDSGTHEWTLSGYAYTINGIPIVGAKINIFRSSYFPGTNVYLGNSIAYGDCQTANAPVVITRNGFAFNSTFTQDTTISHGVLDSGYSSYNLAYTSGATQFYWNFNNGLAPNSLTDMAGLSPNHTYNMYAYVYVPSGTGPSLSNIALQYLSAIANGGSAFTVVASSNTPSSYNAWWLLTMRFTVSPGETGSVLRINVNEVASGENIWVDDVILQDQTGQIIPLADTIIATTFSNSSGYWTAQMPPGAYEYYIVGYDSNSPDKAGVTINSLTPS